MLSFLFAFLPLIHSASDLSDCLPFSEEAIEQVAEKSTAQFQEDLDQFLKIPDEERTFDNTVRLWDLLTGELLSAHVCLRNLASVYPEKNLRTCGEKTAQRLEAIYQDALVTHPEVYEACFLVQTNGPELSESEQYYLDQLLLDFRHRGMQLDEGKRAFVRQTLEEISSLSALFHLNVTEDRPTLCATREELVGLESSWIELHERDHEGRYQLPVNFSNYQTVLSNCTDRNTRKKMYELFANCAYPQNEEVIVQLIAKRDQLAKLLGFSSHAAQELSRMMAGSFENVQEFLALVKKHIAPKAEQQFNKTIEVLPEGVSLTATGQLERFDNSYVRTAYKKKHFSVDPDAIAEYFPLDKTIQGLIQIYEQFFSLSIKEVPHSIPIPDLKALEIRDQTDTLLGVVLLDLFPREGKCPHLGSERLLVAAFSPPGGVDYPGVCVLLCNFAKTARGNCPLMKFGEVTIFFHEFGHALHEILGRNEFWLSCGNGSVKQDFVEVPSLLLENWVRSPAILKKISSHYLTEEPLPDEMIQNLLRAEAFNKVNAAEGDRFLSEAALAFFGEGEVKDPTQLYRLTWQRESPYLSLGNTHPHAAWWHIPGYGPKYYAYLWSEAFACDLFEKIREQGLLNPEVGNAYVKAILSKGGGCDPNRMLVEFLGREASFEPFFQKFFQE